MLLAHFTRRAASRTLWTAGSNSDIRMAMIASTTKSSMIVKPRGREERDCLNTFSPVGQGAPGLANCMIAIVVTAFPKSL